MPDSVDPDRGRVRFYTVDENEFQAIKAEVERLREALRDLIWAATELSEQAEYTVPVIVEEEFVSALDDARKVLGDA